VAPIPKSKSPPAPAAIKDVFRVLREKGAVGIFPEGNRTVSGGQWEMTEAIAKLAKAAKVPLVLYNLCGGYGTDPRWGHNIRKGRFHGYVRRILSPEEVKAMPLEELFAAICDGLKVDDTVSGVHFKSRRRAEYIERALYLCPQCGALLTQTPGRKRVKFCSDNCRTAWWNAHPEKVNRKAVYHFTCAHCGKPFTAYGNTQRKYCSHACYIADRYKGGDGHE